MSPYIYSLNTDAVFECFFDYSPAERGSREDGVQMEPDYPESVEVCSVLCNGVEIMDYLSEDTLEDITDKIMESLNDYDE